MTKQTKTTLDTINQLIANAKSGKQAYRQAIQEASVLFVKEYNNSLTFNTTPFKAIIEVLSSDVTSWRNWLFKYTNITKVYSDLLHFETDEYTLKDSSKKYTLKFKENFAGQLWYEDDDKTKKEKVFDDDAFKKSVIGLYKNYAEKHFTELNSTNETLLQAIKEAYNL
jgi:hypothetical protein